MPQFKAPAPKGREETPEEKAAWLALRKHVNDLELLDNQQFDLPGRIVSILGDPNDETGERPIWKENPRKPGTQDAYLTVVTKLDDPRYAALTFRKDMKISFFDGVMRGQANKSAFRGMFYYIHRAATGQEPPAALVNGTASFDPADYCDRPMRVVFDYLGRTDKDSEWYGRTGNIRIFINRFEPPKGLIRREDDEEEAPFVPANGSAASASAPEKGAGDTQPAPPEIDDEERAALEAFRASRKGKQATLPVGDELGLPV